MSRNLLLAALAVALSWTCALAAEVEFISPRDGLLTTEDTLVVVGRAQRGRRLNWSVHREGATERDTVTADWGNLFEIFVILEPGLNRVRVEDASLEVFYDPGGGAAPEGFGPQFVHAGDLALCENCHDPRHVRLLDGGYPWVCFGCHLVVSANPDNTGEAKDDEHFRAAVADCGRCHEPHVSGDPKLRRASTTELCAECHPQRRDTPSSHPALEEGECSACHDPHYSGYPANLHQPLPGLCQRCHDQGLDSGEPHPALSGGGSCDTCHDPHGDTEGLLRAEVGALCAGCHGEITRHGHGEELAECTRCHDPHGTRHGGMLRDTAAAECLACHDGIDRGSTRHAALNEGCQACHHPHDDANRARARQSCTRCHDLTGNRELASLHGNLNLTAASCGVCHPPHASNQAGLVRGNLHQPLAQGNCSACHGGGADRSTVVADPAQRCRMCHDFEKAMQADGVRRHEPVIDGECTACHDPHMSTRPALLRGPEAAVCGECHDGLLEGDTVHPPAEEDCTGCHAPHGGANPRFLPEASIEAVCLECHDDPREGLAELHPALDDGCTACHDPHAGAAPGLQRGADGPATCAACHDTPELGPGQSRHTAAADCTACHRPHGGDSAPYLRFAPDTLCTACHGDLLEGDTLHPPAEEDCGTCHDPHGGYGGANLRAPQPELCLECHDDPTADLAHPHPPAQGACSGCHDPHGGDRASLLRAAGSDLCRRCHPFPAVGGRRLHEAAAECDNCHGGGGHGFEAPKGLEETPPELCLQCHDDPTDGGGALHPALEEGCLVCHDPHVGTGPGLMAGAWAGEPCLACHDDPRSEGPTLHAPLADGCSACHEPHASAAPQFLRRTGNALCRGCHPGEHRHTLDPARGAKYPGADDFPVERGEYACTGCHTPHAADAGALYRGPSGEFCVRCHQI